MLAWSNNPIIISEKKISDDINSVCEFSFTKCHKLKFREMSTVNQPYVPHWYSVLRKIISEGSYKVCKVIINPQNLARVPSLQIY